MFARSLPVLSMPVAAALTRFSPHTHCEPSTRDPWAIAIATSRRHALRLGIGSINGNKYSEDSFAVDEFSVGGEPISVLSVFDGHGGSHVAKYLEQEMPSAMRHRLPNAKIVSVDPGCLRDALLGTYCDLEEGLCRRSEEALKFGVDCFARVGSCAITVAVTASHLVVANSGDCRAVLGKRGGLIQELSTVHNVNNPDEREKLRQEHPDDPLVVKCTRAYLDPDSNRLYRNEAPGLLPQEMNCYIKGMLQPSRSFGDFALKRQDSKTYITAEPEVRIFRRADDDDLLVIASDGLFDDLKPEEVLSIARQAGAPAAAADSLVQAARTRALETAGMSETQYRAMPLELRRKVHDDITALVYFL